MTHSFRSAFVLICVLIAPLVVKGDEVDDYIQIQMGRQHIPGLSLVVLRDGKIIKAKGYGLASLELNVPARPETVYELASATKPFVATAVLMLMQDGIIDLDDKISRYIENTPDSWKNITVRHLLTHTSGIKDYLGDLQHDFPHDTSPDQFAKALMVESLKFPPGQKWSYSNTGYVLLGIIVHKLSGKTYDAYLNERLFRPLGMTSTRRDSPDEIVLNRAVGYLWLGPGGLRNGDFLKYLMMNHGDRGILSTVLDLAKWDTALSANTFLNSASRQAMWAPVTLNGGDTFDYGLGWFLGRVNGHRHIFHPGGAPGTSTIVSRYPDDKLTVIILSNGGGAYAQGLDLGVAQRYIPGLWPRASALDTVVLDSYTGYYNAYGSQVLRVTREKGALILNDGGGLTNTFLPLSENRFLAEDADRGFILTRAANGEVSGMVLRLGQDEMNVQRMGPLARSIKPQSDTEPGLTRQVEAVLKAMMRGGKAVEEVANIAPQARKDFSRGPAPELGGIRTISFIASWEVSGQQIERHGGQVSRVVYYKLFTDKEPRFVLVYLTADGLVTDEDVVVD